MSHSVLGKPLLCRSCAYGVASFSRQTRNFTGSTTLRKAEVPVFKPTSSPELDALLARFRNDLFIPKSLGARHQDYIFKQRHAETLRQRPIYVNVGSKGTEENYQLRPLLETQLPATKHVREVVDMMKTREDWSNLAPFLSGLQIAGRKLSDDVWARIFRKLGDAGCEDIAYKLASHSSHTGLTLNRTSVARPLFYIYHSCARKAEFKGEALERALTLAKSTALLFNSAKHTSSIASKDPRRKPDIIGILLELSAARAIDANGGKDQDNQVVSYAEKVVDTWSFGDFELPELREANWKLHEFLPLWHGMKIALNVEEVAANSTLRGQLESKLKELGSKIAHTASLVPQGKEGATPAGILVKQQLFDKK